MLTNFLKVFFRSIRRNAFFSFLNILGLVLGLSVSYLITLYVVDEMSYDNFHEDGSRIYQVGLTGVLSGNEFTGASTCAPMSKAISEEVSGVESSIRLSDWGSLLIHHNDQQIIENDVLFADSNFFHFFTYDLLAGSQAQALTKPKSIVLTELTAQKYFSGVSYDQVVGKSLVLGDDRESYQVTGIMRNPPTNSHLEFPMMISMSSWERAYNDRQWTSNYLYTYYKAREGVEELTITAQFEQLVAKYVGPEIEQYIGISLAEFKEGGGDYGYFSIPLQEVHFSSLDGQLGRPGNKQNISIFSVVALFVLIIAGVNFVNLSTAKASDRAKEIGVRKAIGARKRELMVQFLLESVALVVISSLISIGVVILVLPYFNELADKQFQLIDVIAVDNLVFTLFASLIIGLLSGLYPSAVLSRYKPVETIKGKPHETNVKLLNPRNVLVGFQFLMTTFALVLTLVVTMQLSHMRELDLGFDKDQLLVLFNAGSIENQRSFINELNGISGVEDASATHGFPSRINNSSVYRLADSNEDHLFNNYYADKDHLASMNYHLIKGRPFEDHDLDQNSVILNETALKLAGWDDIEGKQILEIDEEEHIPYNVVGVVEDFVFEDFKSEIRPLIIFCEPEGRFITLRIAGGDQQHTISQVEDVWGSFSGGKPFDYSFVDRQFDRLFRTEQRLANLIILFSVLTVITASLGLFGLAAFVARKRRKEFGIRKILGANEATIWLLQLKYFGAIATFALIIALPIAFYFSDQWLQEFNYRIDNGLEIYAIAAIGVIIVTLFSVGYQSLKASRLQPSTVLREE